MYLRRKVIVIGAVVLLLGVLGVSQLQAQEQKEAWRDQLSQILEIVIDIQSGLQYLTDNVVSRHEAQSLETRIEALERIVLPTATPTATPTVTPYQEVREQEEQSLHRELILFLYQQDIAVFEGDEQFMSAEEYIDDFMGTVVILARWCEISVYDMVKLIDLAAKRKEAERGGGPAYHSGGRPYMTRLRIATPWLFADSRYYCQEE